MPTQLQSNAMVWLYFKNDLAAKRGKCIFCEQYISYAKSTFSNLKRHLIRKHANLLDKRITHHVHYVWNHFERESHSRVKCNYCASYISCPNKSVYNMVRHMKHKHPTIAMRNQAEYIQQYENDEPEALYDAIEETFKEPLSMNEAELELESNLNAIEMISDESSSSVKIEYSNTHLDRNVQQRQSQQDNEIISHNEANSSNHETNQREASFETNRHHDVSTSAAIQTDEGSIGQHSYRIGIKNTNVRSSAYATNIALELESLGLRQRIVAEKLISDVLFNAKLENLTEHSMVLAKPNHLVMN